MAALTNLTAEQIRKIRDYIPELSNRPPGFDLGQFLSDMIDEIDANDAAIKSGQGDITGAATTVVIAVGAAYDAKPVVASLTVVTGGADYVKSAVWDGSGNLTITLNTAPGGGNTATVSYIVDAR